MTGKILGVTWEHSSPLIGGILTRGRGWERLTGRKMSGKRIREGALQTTRDFDKGMCSRLYSFRLRTDRLQTTRIGLTSVQTTSASV